jgi:hypothetical protein
MTESSLRSARDADYARILVRGDYELRSGRRLSASTKSALQDMVKAHKDGSKQLHKGLQAHVTALLAGKTLPNPSQGGTLQDGTTSGGGGQNGWNAPDQPSVSTDGAGSRNRRLTPAQRSLLMLQKEKFDDEIRESRIQRDAVLDILREQKAEDRKRWTKRDRLRREALERANQPTDLQRMNAK